MLLKESISTHCRQAGRSDESCQTFALLRSLQTNVVKIFLKLHLHFQNNFPNPVILLYPRIMTLDCIRHTPGLSGFQDQSQTNSALYSAF